MIFLATDSNSGRPVWVHVIAEPVDPARAWIVRRAQAFIQAAGGQDPEDFLEYGYHDKTHYVITASRPECKELGPYLDTLLALRGIEVPKPAASMESAADKTIADDRTQEITSRLRRVEDSTASRVKLAGAAASGIGRAEPPPQERTMSSQPTMYLRPDDVRQAIESGSYSQQAAETPTRPPGDRSRGADSPGDTETTIRFVRPNFAESGTQNAFDPDQTAQVVSPWTDKKRPECGRQERVPPRPVPVPARREEKKPEREYPVWAEQARRGQPPTSPPNAYHEGAVSEPRVPLQAVDDTKEHKNGSGSHRLVLPPVRRPSPAMSAAAMPAPDLAPAALENKPRGGADPRLLYMTLALVMVSLAAIALGLGWYIHSTVPVSAPPSAAVAAPAAAGGGAADPSGAAQPDASAPANPVQAAAQQPAGAAISPLLLSIAFISAVLIFAAVVVLFMAVKKGV